MKRLFKNIICAVLAPVALVSCMDLDENVYDKLPTDEFGTTEKQINAIMAPAYQSLKNMLAYDGPWGAADMTADTCRWRLVGRRTIHGTMYAQLETELLLRRELLDILYGRFNHS